MIRASGPVFCEDSVKKDFITWIAVTSPGASGPVFCEDSVKKDFITWIVPVDDVYSSKSGEPPAPPISILRWLVSLGCLISVVCFNSFNIEIGGAGGAFHDLEE